MATGAGVALWQVAGELRILHLLGEFPNVLRLPSRLFPRLAHSSPRMLSITCLLPSTAYRLVKRAPKSSWNRTTRRSSMLEANEGKKLIVGLGNPGSKYNGTRHNIGFDFVDQIAEKYGITMTKTKFNSIYGGTVPHKVSLRFRFFFAPNSDLPVSFLVGTIGERSVVLVKPQTFMNLSGASVKPWLEYYKVEHRNWFVDFLGVTRSSYAHFPLY